MDDLKGYRKEFVTKKGKRVTFRPPGGDEDMDQLLRFVNELVDEDTFITMTRRFTREEEARWLDERLKDIEEERGFNLLAIHGKKIVASASVHRQGNRSEHVGGLGIAVSQNFRDEGSGTALLKEAITLAQDFLGVRMLTLRVFANNGRAIHVYEKLGFRECGRVPGAILYRGEYVDEVFMYMILGG